MSSSTSSTIKLVLNNVDTRRVQFSFNEPQPLQRLKQLIVQAYSLDNYNNNINNKVSIRYLDDEEELITISSDNELLEASRFANANGKALKLFVSADVSASNVDSSASSDSVSSASSALDTSASEPRVVPASPTSSASSSDKFVVVETNNKAKTSDVTVTDITDRDDDNDNDNEGNRDEVNESINTSTSASTSASASNANSNEATTFEEKKTESSSSSSSAELPSAAELLNSVIQFLDNPSVQQNISLIVQVIVENIRSIIINNSNNNSEQQAHERLIENTLAVFPFLIDQPFIQLLLPLVPRLLNKFNQIPKPYQQCLLTKLQHFSTILPQILPIVRGVLHSLSQKLQSNADADAELSSPERLFQHLGPIACFAAPFLRVFAASNSSCGANACANADANATATAANRCNPANRCNRSDEDEGGVNRARDVDAAIASALAAAFANDESDDEEADEKQAESPVFVSRVSRVNDNNNNNVANNVNGGVVHSTVQCDGCSVFPIRGNRYKCTVCPDFDLCEACEARSVHPSHHVLIKMKQPFDSNNGKPVHRSVACDGCGVSPIVGIRYKCRECFNYDLCERCEARDVHPRNHNLSVIRTPVEYSRPQPHRSHPHPHPHPHPRFGFAGARPHPRFGFVHPVFGGAGPCHRYRNHQQQQQQSQQTQQTQQTPSCASWFGQWGRSGHGCGRNNRSFTAASSASSTNNSAHDSKASEGNATLPKRFNAEFVADVSLPNESYCLPAVDLMKVWKVRNNGNQAWPETVKLEWIGGEVEPAQGRSAEVDVDVAEVDQLVNVSVRLITPKKAGRFTGVFRLYGLVNGGNEKVPIGEELRVVLNVVDKQPPVPLYDNWFQLESEKKAETVEVASSASNSNNNNNNNSSSNNNNNNNNNNNKLEDKKVTEASAQTTPVIAQTPTQASAPAPAQTSPFEEKYKSQIKAIVEMGFDKNLALDLLTAHQGNLQQVLDVLFNN